MQKIQCANIASAKAAGYSISGKCRKIWKAPGGQRPTTLSLQFCPHNNPILHLTTFRHTLSTPRFFIGLCLTFVSCKKDDNSVPAGKLGLNYPLALNNIITIAQLDSMEKYGMTINEGLTPPTANGTYLMSPQLCTFDNSGYNTVGSVYDDYKYKFSNENTSEFTIDINYEDISNTDDKGSAGSAIYITGTNNLFTIYAQSQGTTFGISYVVLQLISGQITSTGIVNLETATLLQSKTVDTDNVLDPVGSIRIFKDENGSSELTTFFVLPSKVQIENIGLNVRLLGGVLSVRSK